MPRPPNPTVVNLGSQWLAEIPGVPGLLATGVDKAAAIARALAVAKLLNAGKAAAIATPPAKAIGTTAPKRRGRPPKNPAAVAAAAAGAAPKRRGRPPKALAAAPTAPKRRGRPPKNPAAVAAAAAGVAPKRRGRPPKALAAFSAAAPTAPKRRGRPPKNPAAVAAAAAGAAPKRRGRPPKARPVEIVNEPGREPELLTPAPVEIMHVIEVIAAAEPQIVPVSDSPDQQLL